MSVVVIAVQDCYIAGSSSLLLGIPEGLDEENNMTLMFQFLISPPLLPALDQVTRMAPCPLVYQTHNVSSLSPLLLL